MKLYEEIKNVESKDDFISFVEMLISDFKQNKDEWENQTVEDYLEGLKSWVEDMEGYYKNTKQPVPENINWNFFVNILYSGKIYE